MLVALYAAWFWSIASPLVALPQDPPPAGGAGTEANADESVPEVGDSDDLTAKSLGVRFGGVLELRMPPPGQRGPRNDRPATIDLSLDRPAELTGTPAFHSEMPLYGAFRLGKGAKTWFALDQSDPESTVYDEIWIDVDQDLDLRSEGTPRRGTGTFVEDRGVWYGEFTNLEFDLYYGHGPRERYALSLYIWYPREGLPEQALAVSASWREGTIYIDDTRVRIGVADGDCDGIFLARHCVYAVVEDRPDVDLLKEAVWRPGRVPVRIRERPFKLDFVSAEGGRADLSPASDEELREAEMREDPTLLEPNRPRDETPIPWVETYDGALAQAASTGRSVFVLVSAPWSRGAVRFEERTLKDAEVRGILNGLICVRLDPDRDRELAERFAVDTLPLVLIVDAQGRVLDRSGGYRGARSLVDTLLPYRKK